MTKFFYALSLFLSLFLFGVMMISLGWSMILLAGTELALEWEVNMINSASINLLLIFDWMSLFFISVVSLISASVLFYSSSYMSSDSFYGRFILLVMSFIFSMWILILSPNFISILLGWDGLGVTSYLLVIYYQSEKSFNAGMITALTNRLGDAGLLIFIGLSLKAGSWSFLYYSAAGHLNFFSPLSLLVLVAMTKSAQTPFSAWLPAAMAAPTPVSSLVHSSTLVTAGVYLLIRLNYILASYKFLWCLALLGGVTMLMAGKAAMQEVDMKKIIALSTLSQLGLMFMTLGMGLPLLAFFHLAAHAYFKAMMFMGAGGIIHMMKDYQDLRAMGAAAKFMPASLSIFLVANLSLCGVPFMTGFFSKDLILELMMMSSVSLLIFSVAMVATGLTVSYSFRIFLMIFFVKPGSGPTLSAGEVDNTMLAGASALLLLPSVFGGLYISWASSSFNYAIFLPSWMKMLVLIIIMGASFLSMALSPKSKKTFAGSFAQFMWFMPFLFSYTASKTVLSGGRNMYLLGDSGWSLFLLLGYFKNLNFNLSNYSIRGLNSGFLKSILFLGLAWMWI